MRLTWHSVSPGHFQCTSYAHRVQLCVRERYFAVLVLLCSQECLSPALNSICQDTQKEASTPQGGEQQSPFPSWALSSRVWHSCEA